MKIKTFKKLIYLTVAFLLTLTLVMIPNTVNAVPSPYLSGDLIGEPIGDLSKLGIIKEKLEFDFRSLKDSGEGIIKASYQIRNDEEQTPLELLFVAREIKDNSFTIDGKIIPAEKIDEPKLPETWKPPEEISGVGGYSTSYDVNNYIRSVWKIKPTIPPGEHLLKVEYLAVPSAYAANNYYDYHIAYILAYARNWAFFNNLEIELKLPKDWQVVSSFPMNNVDNILKASLNEIPADYFVFSTRPYFPWYIIRGIYLIQNIIFIVGLIAPVYVGYLAVKISIKKIKIPFFIAGIFTFILGGIAFAILAIISFIIKDYLLNYFSIKQHTWVGVSNNMFFGAAIIVFLVFFLSGFVAVISGNLFNRKLLKK